MDSIKKLSPYAHWAIRIAAAGVFIYHGATKFPNLSGGAQMMGQPVALWTLVAILEILGGIFILVGGFLPDWVTRLGGLFILPPFGGHFHRALATTVLCGFRNASHGWYGIPGRNVAAGNLLFIKRQGYRIGT